MKITIPNPVSIDGELVAAASLEGTELPGDWRVIRLLRDRDQRLGAERLSGSTFSFGYEVKNADGRTAFLKALDYHMAFRSPRAPDALATMTNRYVFERDLLHDLCRRHNLSRVVRVLEANGVDVNGPFPIPHVDYLIFEMADGDVRAYLSLKVGIDDAWRFSCLKDVAALRPRSCQGGWHGDFKAVLPHLEHAFSAMMAEFKTHMSRRLNAEMADELTDLTRQLCHPNPARRGHRRNRIGAEQPYGLARFISGFDLLGKKASVRLKHPSPQRA